AAGAHGDEARPLEAADAARRGPPSAALEPRRAVGARRRPGAARVHDPGRRDVLPRDEAGGADPGSGRVPALALDAPRGCGRVSRLLAACQRPPLASPPIRTERGKHVSATWARWPTTTSASTRASSPAPTGGKTTRRMSTDSRAARRRARRAALWP